MTDIVKQLRDAARQIIRDNETAPYPTWKEDRDLLLRAANEIEQLRAQVDSLRREAGPQ